MHPIFAVFIGGGLGAMARFGVGELTAEWRDKSGFPVGTLIVNVLGCLLIGLLAAYFAARQDISPAMQAFITAGFLGGLTTFSAFGLESVQLLNAGSYGPALLSIGLNILAGLGAVALGLWAGKAIFG
jgi:CrcB protein